MSFFIVACLVISAAISLKMWNSKKKVEVIQDQKKDKSEKLKKKIRAIKKTKS